MVRSVNSSLETSLDKLETLGKAARFDVCAPSSIYQKFNDFSPFIYSSVTSKGERVPLLKVLLSSKCQNDCFYCAIRASRSTPRLTFKPEELARVFLELYQKGRVKGLFLSSAILISPNYTMEMMLKTVEILRIKAGFKGYIHLKILPGSDYSYVERAVELANRVSVNLEAPNARCLAKICPNKRWDDLATHLNWLTALKKKKSDSLRGVTTQFVVGAAGETDREILETASFLYRKLNLSRVYFSAFRPVPRTPLEEKSPTSSLRERRLYEAGFLMRFYGFKFEELVFDQNKKLLLKMDPKMAWAVQNKSFFPVDIRKASYKQLLRVPGIGPLSASRLAKLPSSKRPKTKEELKRFGVVAKRACPFILLDGRLPYLS